METAILFRGEGRPALAGNETGSSPPQPEVRPDTGAGDIRPSPGKRVLILVENLPSPFDRRVWQEATTLR
ncbi:MAG TPA: hypothetical protein VF096_17485, partial [Azonexus sp.]